MDILLTTNEVAEMVGKTAERIHQLRRTGVITGLLRGNAYFYNQGVVKIINEMPDGRTKAVKSINLSKGK